MRTVLMAHTASVDHALPGQKVTTLCGRILTIGHDAQVYDPTSSKPAIRCPICEAMSVIAATPLEYTQPPLF